MAVFITAITTKVVSDLLVKAGGGAFNSALTSIKGKRKNHSLYQNICDTAYNEEYAKNVINKVFTFRTIINGDRDVYLDQIYHPLKLTSPNDDVLIVDDGFTLPKHTSSCLVGYAGQGKTITMKKMFLEDLNKDDFFPLFISLRVIDFSKRISVPEVLFQHFESHGVKSDIESITNFLNKITNIRIYFDGFDEVHHNERDNALALLDECSSMWKINIICSSRPDTQICKKPGFLVYSVKFLDTEDVEEIININVKNTDTKSTLLTILHGKDFLLESIKSPILVDIFIVTSIGLGKKPENIVNYYESLFSSLVYKHDFNKIFTRARKSNLTDTQMEQCLSYFAFVSQLKQQTNFTYSDMVEAFLDAKIIIGKDNDDEKNIIEDVVEITNLITRDGFDNYTFIHKSIQDFYAAKFISTSTEENQVDFFKESLNVRLDLNFCYMLKSLHPASYYPYFIKDKINSLDFDKESPKYPCVDDVIEYLKDTTIMLEKVYEEDRNRFKLTGAMSSSYQESGFPFSLLNEIKDYMFLSSGSTNPVSSIFSYWAMNKLYDDKNYTLIESHITERKGHKENLFSMDAKNFMKTFPGFLKYLDVVVKDSAVLIDEIFEEYDSAMSKVNSRNHTTQKMIKSLMQKGKR
jgi:hypothetical protein